MALTYRRA